MEIKVNTYNINELSEEFRCIGINLLDIISEYNTVSYEILNEIDLTEFGDVKTYIDELRNILDEGFLTVKKHEKFLIDTYQDYNYTEGSIVNDVTSISNNLYKGNTIHINSSLSFTPVKDILSSINPVVMPLITNKLPNSNIDKVNVSVGGSNIIIEGLKDNISHNSVSTIKDKNKLDLNGNKTNTPQHKLEFFYPMIGIIGSIAPGAYITGNNIINFINRDLINNLLLGIENKNNNNNEIGSYNGSYYESLTWLLGQCFQTNYNLIEAFKYNLILQSILQSNLFIGELSKYDKLSDILYQTPNINMNYGSNKEEVKEDKKDKKELERDKETKFENSESKNKEINGKNETVRDIEIMEESLYTQKQEKFNEKYDWDISLGFKYMGLYESNEEDNLFKFNKLNFFDSYSTNTLKHEETTFSKLYEPSSPNIKDIRLSESYNTNSLKFNENSLTQPYNTNSLEFGEINLAEPYNDSFLNINELRSSKPYNNTILSSDAFKSYDTTSFESYESNPELQEVYTQEEKILSSISGFGRKWDLGNLKVVYSNSNSQDKNHIGDSLSNIDLEKTEYTKSGIFYDRILSEIYGKNISKPGFEKIAGIATGIGVAGAAVTGGFGYFGATANVVSGSLNSKTGVNILNHVIGALDFNNIFDLVGKAQMCNLDWLSEFTNILA